MSTSTTTKSDHEVQIAVENEMHWSQDVDESAIGVSVQRGVVTLSGEVLSYQQKTAAAKTALRTRGVTAVANDLVVRLVGDQPTDSDLALAARMALDTAASVPAGSVKVEVRDRYVILTGAVMWNYQREAARKSVCRLAGIRAVDNRITLTPRPAASATETEDLIRSAITRQAAVDASRIKVRATGDGLELTGTVSSWAEKRQAEFAAWSSPHVRHVHNHIEVKD